MDFAAPMRTTLMITFILCVIRSIDDDYFRDAWGCHFVVEYVSSEMAKGKNGENGENGENSKNDENGENLIFRNWKFNPWSWLLIYNPKFPEIIIAQTP